MANRTVVNKSQPTKQTEQYDPFDDEEETPFYVWTDMLKTEGEGDEAIEYFDDSVLEAGSPEDKTSKEDPSVTYATVPLTCRYLLMPGEPVAAFMFELPEKEYPYGVSCLPSKGKINFSIMCRWSKNNPVDVRFTDVFVAGLYGWFVKQTAENEWHYRAGGDDEFDIEKPGKYLRPWIRFPKDKTTKKPKTDGDKQWYITLMNNRDEKTVFTVPVPEGQKPIPIDWKKLENLSLTMIVTVQCLSIYLGSGKVCPQFRAVSGVISKRPKRGGKVVNIKTANRLAKDNPGLSMGINHVLDSIEVDNPTSCSSGFTSSVKGEGCDEGEEGDEGDEFVKTTSVRAGGGARGAGGAGGGRGGKGVGNVEGFINSGKMRGGGGGRGAGGATNTGRGTGGRGRGGTTVINRRPPPTPSKGADYDDDGQDMGGDDGESYE